MYKTCNKAILDLLGDDFNACESPSLRLEKFLNLSMSDSGSRNSEVKHIVQCHNKFRSEPVVRKYAKARQLVARLEANLIINQSGGVLENAGICLHPLRGYPYIPGSSIRGVALQAAWLQWQQEKSEELALRIADVFGFPTQKPELDLLIKQAQQDKELKALASKLSFLPAMAIGRRGEILLQSDICTPHHRDYYDEKSEFAFDNEDPVPLAFPTVKEGTHFLFRIMPLPRADEQCIEDAENFLVLGLTELGLGAKTNAGYGWFYFCKEYSADFMQRLTEEKQRQAAAKLEAEKQQAKAEEQRRLEQQRAEENINEKARLAAMSEGEREDERLSQLDEQRFQYELGRLALKKDPLNKEQKNALLRALKGPRKQMWLDMKSWKKGFNKQNWPHICKVIYALNKEFFPGEKMP